MHLSVALQGSWYSVEMIAASQIFLWSPMSNLKKTVYDIKFGMLQVRENHISLR